MKNALLVLFAFNCFLANAQAPQEMNYQTVVRDNTGNPVANTPVTLRFIIHDGSSSGTIEYTEVQSTTSNQFGLVNVQIGSVTSLSGVNWSSSTKWLEVDVNINGGGYDTAGISQLISVPYALYAANSGATGTGWSDYAVYTEEVGSGDTALTQLSDTAWRSRQLNYTEKQVGSSISLNGGNITVQPGTYHISASAELGFWFAEVGGNNVNALANSLLRLYNLQNDSTLIKGLTQRIFVTYAPVNGETMPYIRQANFISIEGEFTISATSNVSLQQYVQYQNLGGNPSLKIDAGKPVSSFDIITGSDVNITGLGNEIYARITIQKIN